jgi:predicted O-methyltransferase YrrM
MPGIDHAEFERMLRGYMHSRALLTALELDTFTAVGHDSSTAAEAARRMDTNPRATEMLLNALVALGLLGKSDGRFHLNELSGRYLAEGSPEDERAGLMHYVNLWHRWSTLTECVRTGTRSDAPGSRRERDSRRTESFIAAMHWMAAETALPVVAALDLKGVRRMLDLGGGSGAFAIAFAQAYPDLKVTVFDLPDVIQLTKGYVAEAGLSDRIDTRPGDMTTDDLGSGHDVVFVSSICHMFGPEQNVSLFERIFDSLQGGGRIAVRDFILSDDKTSPPFGALFALNMLVNTAKGASYSRAEYVGWLEQAGFRSPRLIDIPGNAAVIVATKP